MNIFWDRTSVFYTNSPILVSTRSRRRTSTPYKPVGQVQVVFVCPMFNFTLPQRTTNETPLFVAWSWAHDCQWSESAIAYVNQFPVMWEPCWMAQLVSVVVFFLLLLLLFTFPPPICSWHGPEPMWNLRLALFINFPLCGNQVEWRSFSYHVVILLSFAP